MAGAETSRRRKNTYRIQKEQNAAEKIAKAEAKVQALEEEKLQARNNINQMTYPRNLDQIPYASFIKISKYTYQEGLAKVAANENSALAALQRSAIAKGMVKTVGFVAEHLYQSGGGRDSDWGQLRNQDSISKKGVYLGGRNGQAKYTKDTSQMTEEQAARWNSQNFMDDKKEITLPNGSKTTMAQLYREKDAIKQNRKKGLQSTCVQIALPNEFSYSYGADWGNTFRLGTLALAAESAGSFMTANVIGGLAGAGLERTMKEMNKRAGNMGGASGYAKKAAGGMRAVSGGIGGVTDKLDMKAVAGMAGLAPNENAIQMFKKMDFRQFRLEFEFAARNATEGADITTIVEWFKRGIHPDSKTGRGSAVLLTFPDVFVLEPMFVPAAADGSHKPNNTPIQHPMMPKTKLCALQSMAVNTAPLGQLNTVFDGNFPVITLSLTFSETTALTRVDFEGARTRKNNAMDKGFVRSSLTKNSPVIGF